MFLENKKKKEKITHAAGSRPAPAAASARSLPRRQPAPADTQRWRPARPTAAAAGSRSCGGPRAPRRRWRPEHPTPAPAAAASAPHGGVGGGGRLPRACQRVRELLNRNVEQQISKKGSHIAYLEGELHGARPAQARERPWLALAVRPIRPVRPVAPRRTAGRRHLRGVQATKRDASSPDLAASRLDPQEGAAACPSTNRDRAYAKCILHPTSFPSGRVSTTPPVHLLNNKRIKGPIPNKQARQSNGRKLCRCNHRS